MELHGAAEIIVGAMKILQATHDPIRVSTLRRWHHYPQQLGRGSCPLVAGVPSTPKPVLITAVFNRSGDARRSSYLTVTSPEASDT